LTEVTHQNETRRLLLLTHECKFSQEQRQEWLPPPMNITPIHSRPQHQLVNPNRLHREQQQRFRCRNETIRTCKLEANNQASKRRDSTSTSESSDSTENTIQTQENGRPDTFIMKPGEDTYSSVKHPLSITNSSCSTPLNASNNNIELGVGEKMVAAPSAGNHPMAHPVHSSLQQTNPPLAYVSFPNQSNQMGSS
ncbi:hypothetical protein PENTCL1PPCAC_12867, partial [Pristionchus entomophagus]